MLSPFTVMQLSKEGLKEGRGGGRGNGNLTLPILVSNDVHLDSWVCRGLDCCPKLNNLYTLFLLCMGNWTLHFCFSMYTWRIGDAELETVTPNWATSYLIIKNRTLMAHFFELQYPENSGIYNLSPITSNRSIADKEFYFIQGHNWYPCPYIFLIFAPNNRGPMYYYLNEVYALMTNACEMDLQLNGWQHITTSLM